MTLEELKTHLQGLGLSEDTIKGLLSSYDLGYAQGLQDGVKLQQTERD